MSKNKLRKRHAEEGSGEASKKAKPDTSQAAEEETAESEAQESEEPNIWKQASAPEEKSRDQEFQEYLEDLFM